MIANSTQLSYNQNNQFFQIKSNFNLATMVNWQAINTVLTVCGFCTAPQQNFILDIKGLDSWTAFTLIDYDDFLSIVKNDSRHTAPFAIGVLKQKRLVTLKFWVEDMTRMSETAYFSSLSHYQVVIIMSASLISQDLCCCNSWYNASLIETDFTMLCFTMSNFTAVIDIAKAMNWYKLHSGLFTVPYHRD